LAAEAVGPWGRLLRGSGLALIAAGGLLAVATLLHPSVETAATITAGEGRLVAAHVAYTLCSPPTGTPEPSLKSAAPRATRPGYPDRDSSGRGFGGRLPVVPASFDGRHVPCLRPADAGPAVLFAPASGDVRRPV